MEKEYSWLRRTIWPIYGEENKKFIPMLIMLAISLFNYTSLRISKDALIMTAIGSGAPVLSFLKAWVVLPCTIGFVILYGFFSDKVSKKNLFYVTLLPFFIFFLLFSLFIYPFTSYLHASPEWMLGMQEFYPRFRYIFPIFGYWGFSLFYVMSELWGNVVITLLFWNFANLNVKKNEVGRFYPLFASYANIGLISAGIMQYYGVSTSVTCACVVVSAGLLALTYWWVNEYVLIKEVIVEVKEKKPKIKLSWKDSALMIIRSKYLLLIAILVLSYGMTANLVEMTWKQIIKELYPSKAAYQAFMGQFFIATGVSTFLIGFFTKNVVSKFGWLAGALITPIIIMATSVMFFGFALYSEMLLPTAYASISLLIAGILGAIQNIASKGTKYSLFDPTVQMAYIPLSDELRIKGKAAVDVIGGRAGKSLGGHIQSLGVLIIGGTQMDLAPFLMFMVIILSLAWIYAAFALSKEYNILLEEEVK